MKRPDPERKSRFYFENLDGLRFICFLSVFFFHSFHTEIDSIKDSGVYRIVKFGVFGNGDLGVNFFFVLSGFLITFLLLEEKTRCGRIDILNFWKRRILRIWPLFYFCVGFGFFIFPILKGLMGGRPEETANLESYLLFLNNFDFIDNGPPDASVLGVLWSVAIEEQFYFFWPFVFLLLERQHLKYAFLSLVGISVGFVAMNESIIVRQYHTLSCAGDLAVGAVGALLVQHENFVRGIQRMNKVFLVALYGLVAVIFFFRQEVFSNNIILHAVERPIIASIFLLVILEQSYCSNSLFKMSSFLKVSRLGKITYGLYCLHFLAILITTTTTSIWGLNKGLLQVLILETSIALLLSIMLATASYRFFELPFLRLKDKYAYQKLLS